MKSIRRIYFPWAIVIAAAALIVSITALGVNIYNTRYNTTGVVSGVSAEMEWKKGGKSTNALDMTPSAGKLYFGASQTSGSKGTSYVFKYKKNSESSYTTVKTCTYNANNTYSTATQLTTTNGSNKYNMQVEKTTNAGTASKLNVDYYIK